MAHKMPEIIKNVGFDFSWDERKVWALKAAVEELPLSELSWHFSIPFLWFNGGCYNLTPQEVLENPEPFKEEYQRMLNANLSYPIDIMENKGRWLILDGLHRLMKAKKLGMKSVRVRKIGRELIPLIVKST